MYGDKVEYHGRVVGLGAGTGAAFALLPAQNATGNWIKVVQRVPVRIALDAQAARRASAARRPVDGGDGRHRARTAAGRAADCQPRAAHEPATRGRRALCRIVRANRGRPSATAAATRARAQTAARIGAGPTRRRGVSDAAERRKARCRRGRRRPAPHAARRRRPPRSPPLDGVELVLGTVALSLATFMNVLDSSIANVSIPTIAGDLGVSPAQGTWVITSFAVANAISVPLTGWLTQRFGQVRLFVDQHAAVRDRLVAVRPGAEHRDR